MTGCVASLLKRGDPRDVDDWERRLKTDRQLADRYQSATQRTITRTLLERAIALGADGFALTGSTARQRRTAISDLDYHVIGARPDASDLSDEVDVYALDESRTWKKLHNGDDFVQWTLRCGFLLHDCGAFRRLAAAVVDEVLWPDGLSKLRRLPEHIALTARLISIGDVDAAQDQTRATITSAARGLLLVRERFPLARGELASQLSEIGLASLGEALERTIHAEPTLEELSRYLALVEAEALVATS